MTDVTWDAEEFLDKYKENQCLVFLYPPLPDDGSAASRLIQLNNPLISTMQEIERLYPDFVEATATVYVGDSERVRITPSKFSALYQCYRKNIGSK